MNDKIVSDEKDKSMLGIWESLNYTRMTKGSMSVFFHNGVCTFYTVGCNQIILLYGIH